MAPARRAPRLVETVTPPRGAAGAFSDPPRRVETADPPPREMEHDPHTDHRSPAVEEAAPQPPPARPAQSPSPTPRPTPLAIEEETSAVGVIIVAGAGPAEASAASAGSAPVVYVVASASSDEARRAHGAGVQLVEFQAARQNPGRARNAGYRHLKKAQPALRFVQFLDAGDTLAPGWIEAATGFMARRPEVALVEGAADEKPAARGGDEEEIMTAGPSFLVRAEAFEAAGGYRGDLPVNETEDLCIRLRRRGAHVWRLGAPMATRRRARGGPAGWWKRATRNGFRYAHGVRLYGGRPERLFVSEHGRALFWGAGLPFLIAFLAALAAAGATIVARGVNPLWAAGAVLAVGVLVYVCRIIALAVSRKQRGGLGSAIAATAAHLPEFLGAWRFYFSSDSKAGSA